MSDYYPPVLRCEIAHAMVRIDRAMHECALENHCKPGYHCPLGGRFAPESEPYQPSDAWETSKH